jgi:uncharacterized cupredoxin-like copper-binding protein
MFTEGHGLVRCRRTAVAILAIVAFAISGCSSGKSQKHAGGTELRVAERDFKIHLPTRTVRAGDVSFAVHNQGPDSHELIVIRERGSRLPLRRDGVTVDEDALERSTPGALEPGSPGTRHLKVHLTPGRYELICNMSGHYLGGMRARLVVQ